MMKKLNRTYVCGIFMLALSLWIGYESTRIPTMLVSNEPGPRLFLERDLTFSSLCFAYAEIS